MQNPTFADFFPARELGDFFPFYCACAFFMWKQIILYVMDIFYDYEYKLILAECNRIIEKKDLISMYSYCTK
jgi:hypothetical protein